MGAGTSGVWRRTRYDVTGTLQLVTEGGVARDAKITMNDPLRAKGMIFYQSGFGDAPVYTVLAVVRNPSDRVPIFACSIIGVGMILHFGRRLLQHLKAEAALRARRALEKTHPVGGEAADSRAPGRVGSPS